MACMACRRAKVKCSKGENSDKCTRCTEKGIECSFTKEALHQQTSRRSKRVTLSEAACTPDKPTSIGKKIKQDASLEENQQTTLPARRLRTRKSEKGNQGSDDDEETKATDAATLASEVASEVPITKRSTHYGCFYLVRSWFSMAFVRRSMSLLSKARSMACKCGFTMDQLMAEYPFQRGMYFLYPILLEPASEQRVLGPYLPYRELPEKLLKAMKCPSTNPNVAHSGGATINDTNEDPVSNRWILAREMVKGRSRFFVSEAFAVDLADYRKIKSVYEGNKQSVTQIFMVDESDHLRAFAQTVAMLPDPKTAPRPILTQNVRLQTKSNTIVTVYQISCMEIINVDRAFFMIEFVPFPNNTNGVGINESEYVPTHGAGGSSKSNASGTNDAAAIDEEKEMEFVLDLLMNG